MGGQVLTFFLIKKYKTSKTWTENLFSKAKIETREIVNKCLLQKCKNPSFERNQFGAKKKKLSQMTYFPQ